MNQNTEQNKKKVIIIGGGVAGLSAAHHLLTKGNNRFEVEIFERRFLGGKARSGEENNHPTEHGFRFFPGFYKHVTQTMKEIPLKGGGSVYKNNLVDTEVYTFLFSKKKGRLDVPIDIGGWVAKFKFKAISDKLKELKRQIDESDIQITPAGKNKLVRTMLEVYTTCYERIESTYDNVSWSEFIGANDKFANYGKDYENLLATGISKNLVAVRADIANSRTGAKLIGQMIWHIISPRVTRADKILNAPTNVAWIDPWKAFLMEKGLKIHTNRRAVSVEFDPAKKNIIGIRHDDVEAAEHKSWDYYNDSEIIKQLSLAEADYFICSMPIERIDEMLERSLHEGVKIKKYDQNLANFKPLWLNTEWMSGIMIYFNVPVDIAKGHVTIADEESAITLISQLQFWEEYLKDNKNKIRAGNNIEVKAILSVIVSNWDAKSKYIPRKGVKFKNLERYEVIDEVKEILFRCEIKKGVKLEIYRNNIIDTFLDSSIVKYNDDLANPRFKQISGPKDNLYNKEPLFINKVHSYHLRPTGYTLFNNLYLASDYIKTNTDLGCMDSADEAARRAVNNIFSKEKIKSVCTVDPYNLPSFFGFFDTARILDLKAFRKGLEYKESIVVKVIYFYLRMISSLIKSNISFLIKVFIFFGILFLFLITFLLNLIFKFLLKHFYVASI